MIKYELEMKGKRMKFRDEWKFNMGNGIFQYPFDMRLLFFEND